MKIHVGDFHLEDIDRIRQETPLGSTISFKIKRKPRRDDTWDEKTVFGVVTAKYPRIFLLKDAYGHEETYSWTDYLIGRYMSIGDYYGDKNPL